MVWQCKGGKTLRGRMGKRGWSNPIVIIKAPPEQPNHELRSSALVQGRRVVRRYKGGGWRREGAV